MPCKCGSTTHARTSHRLCPLRRNQGGPVLAGDARDFNPLSQWEEHVLVPGLTLWQLNRPTWALVTEAGEAGEAARADGLARSTGSTGSAESAGLAVLGGGREEEGHLRMPSQVDQEVAEPPAAGNAEGSREVATISINLRSFSEFKVRRGFLQNMSF